MRRCEVLHCYRRYWLRYWRGGITALRWFHHLADEWVVLFFAQDPRQGFGSSPHVRSGIGVFPMASAGFPCLPAGCSRRISFASSGSSPRAKPGIKVRGQTFSLKTPVTALPAAICLATVLRFGSFCLIFFGGFSCHLLGLYFAWIITIPLCSTSGSGLCLVFYPLHSLDYLLDTLVILVFDYTVLLPFAWPPLCIGIYSISLCTSSGSGLRLVTFPSRSPCFVGHHGHFLFCE